MGSRTVRLDRTLNRANVETTLATVQEAVRNGPGTLVLDMEQVQSFDTAGMGAVLLGLKQARARGVDVKFKGVPPSMFDFFSLVSIERLVEPKPATRKLDAVSRVGAAMEPILDSFSGLGKVAWQTFENILVAPWRGRDKRIRLDRLAIELESCAYGALPIVCLIAFLLGLILAMQAYVQLQMWSAEIYMANMVGVSVLYEIGPLMTAIILAARSGSSNAAQLGSMVVSEEIDALKQMGIDPNRFLAVPKVLALAFSTLALCLVFDCIAMVGGAVFAYAFADIEVSAYFQQTQQALSLGDFLVAGIKCIAFGLCIGVIGCGLGLRVRGGSEGVGRATTHAVVSSIFLIIIIDAIFVTLQQLTS